MNWTGTKKFSLQQCGCQWTLHAPTLADRRDHWKTIDFNWIYVKIKLWTQKNSNWCSKMYFSRESEADSFEVRTWLVDLYSNVVSKFFLLGKTLLCFQFTLIIPVEVQIFSYDFEIGSSTNCNEFFSSKGIFCGWKCVGCVGTRNEANGSFFSLHWSLTTLCLWQFWFLSQPKIHTENWLIVKRWARKNSTVYFISDVMVPWKAAWWLVTINKRYKISTVLVVHLTK